VLTVHYSDVKLAKPDKNYTAIVLVGKKRGFRAVVKGSAGGELALINPEKGGQPLWFKLANCAWLNEDSTQAR
jgi:hypothetical protein